MGLVWKKCPVSKLHPSKECKTVPGEPEGQGGKFVPPHILTDQFTLFQMGGQIISITLLLAPPPGFLDLPSALNAR